MKHDFKYISKNNAEVKKAYQDIIAMLNEVQNIVKDKFTFRYDVVGSYKRNMITYDAKSNIGFDFDINIEVNDDENEYSPKDIKEVILINAFRKVVGKYGYENPENSTRVITIRKVNKKNSTIIHSCDFAIVNNYIDNDNNECQEYIHFDKKHNRYYWNEQSAGFYMLPEKIEWLKSGDDGAECWNVLREIYIQKKNANNNPNVHSRQLFAIAVHELCVRLGFFE